MSTQNKSQSKQKNKSYFFPLKQFRLVQNTQGTQKNREQSIFEKITTLDDDRNIIEEF
jgi:hypothetical protein